MRSTWFPTVTLSVRSAYNVQTAKQTLLSKRLADHANCGERNIIFEQLAQ